MEKEIGKLIYETPNNNRRFVGILGAFFILSLGVFVSINTDDFTFAGLFLILTIVLAIGTLIGQATPRLRIYENGLTKPSRLTSYLLTFWPSSISTHEIVDYRIEKKMGLISFTLKNGKKINIWTKPLKKKEVELIKSKILIQCSKKP